MAAMAEVVDRETGEVTVQEPSDFPDLRLNQKFVQLRQGKPFVAYPGLLDLLHQLSEGFFAIDTEVLQLPTAENNLTAVCQARVRIFDPQDADVVRRLTTGIGDADPSNVSAQMKPHLLRMAETRAKARALRDAVNVGMAALEELGPDEAPERREEPRQAPVPGAQHIVVEGKTYSRDEVQRAWHQRVREGVNAGLAGLEALERQVPGTTPLGVLVGQSQEIKRRLEAKGSAGK